MKSKLIIIVALLASYLVSAQPSGYLGKKTQLYVETGLAPSIMRINDKRAKSISQSFSIGIERVVTNHHIIGLKYSNQVFSRDIYGNDLKDFHYGQYSEDDLSTLYLTRKERENYGYAIAYSDGTYYTTTSAHSFKLVFSSVDKIAPIGKNHCLDIGLTVASIHMMNINQEQAVELDSNRFLASPTLGYTFMVQKPLADFLFIRYGLSMNMHLNGFFRSVDEFLDLGYFSNPPKSYGTDWKILQYGMHKSMITDSFFKLSIGIGLIY